MTGSNLRRACAASTLFVSLLLVGELRAAETYDINVVMPLTGGGSFLGKAEQEAIRLAEKVVNDGGGIHGQKVRFVFHDDQSSPQTAVQLTSGILTQKPKVIIGSSLAGMCNAMAPLMKNGPVMYCLSPGIHPPAGSYVFTSNTSTSDLIASQVHYFSERGWKRIAILTSTDATGQDAEREFKKAIALPENKGVEVVESAHFNTTDVTADAQVQTIKGKNPQAFIAWTSGTALGTVLKSIAHVGLDVPVATSNSNMNPVQMAQYKGFAPKELYFSSSNWLPNASSADLPPDVRKSKEAFLGAFNAAGLTPSNPSALAWDPVMILVAALRTLPANASAADLRAYLEKLKGFAGAVGVYDFAAAPQRGLDDSSCVVTLWNPASNDWQVVSGAKGNLRSK